MLDEKHLCVSADSRPSSLAHQSSRTRPLDVLSSILSYQLIASRASGASDKAIGDLQAAIEEATKRKAVLSNIVSMRQYLRTSNLPSRFAAHRSSGQIREIRRPFQTQARDLSAIDRKFWKPVNRVQLQAGGKSTMVLFKDDLGNWHLKHFRDDKDALIESAFGMTVGVLETIADSSGVSGALKGMAERAIKSFDPTTDRTSELLGQQINTALSSKEERIQSTNKSFFEGLPKTCEKSRTEWAAMKTALARDQIQKSIVDEDGAIRRIWNLQANQTEKVEEHKKALSSRLELIAGAAVEELKRRLHTRGEPLDCKNLFDGEAPSSSADPSTVVGTLKENLRPVAYAGESQDYLEPLEEKWPNGSTLDDATRGRLREEIGKILEIPAEDLAVAIEERIVSAARSRDREEVKIIEQYLDQLGLVAGALDLLEKSRKSEGSDETDEDE